MKLEKKHLIKIGIAAFLLFLCIYYWETAAKFLSTLFSAAAPLILGCVIAYILNILMSFYERHWFPKTGKRWIIKLRKPLSLVFALISVFAIVALVIVLIVPQLADCAELLMAEIPDAARSLMDRLDALGVIPENISDTLKNIDWQTVLSRAGKILASGIGGIMDVVVNTVSSVVSGVASFVIGLIFALYILMSKDTLKRQCGKLMKRYMRPKWYAKTTRVLVVADDSFHRYIVGQCTEAVILGVLCMIGMWILGIPYAPMIGALIAFTALIPVAGAYIGAGVGAFMIFTVSPMKALIFLIFILVLQQIEGNLIYPKVVGSSMGLPGIWVLAAVTIGGGLMGIMGMLIGVPIAATVYRLLRTAVNKPECVEEEN